MKAAVLANPEWCDLVVVARVLCGRDPGRDLTPAERREALRQMHAAGESRTQCCARLRLSVARYRALLAEIGEAG